MTIYSINIISTLALLYIGMMGLNLSMDKQFKNIFERKISLSQSRILYGLGWLFLAAALASSIAAWGISIGIAAWFGIATFMVGVLIYIQAYWPRWAWHISLVLLVIVIFLQIFRAFL